MKIKKGDQVKITIGKDSGRTGEVIKSSPKKQTVTVKGLNQYKKHIKPSQGQPGRIIEKERPLHVSKVSLICPGCQKSIRVAYKTDKSGAKYRVCRKCGALLDKSKK